MKKLITNVFFGVVMMTSFQASAQYCGSSQVIFPDCGVQSTPGFGDINTYKCITRGQFDTLVIPFKVYTMFTASHNTVHIYKLRIDVIDSLPCGLCWSTSQSAIPGNGPNEFSPGESGCIRIAGTTFDRPGSYKLLMKLDVRTQATTTTGYDVDSIPSDAGGIVLWVKVINPGDLCPDTIYTSQPSKHPSASCASETWGVGIHEVSTSLTNLTIQPNPVSSEAKVTFISENGGNQQLKISSLVGSEVYSTTLTAKSGLNETTISRNNLPAGIYILSVGSSQGIATKKFIITE
jgi:hypothetical protein